MIFPEANWRLYCCIHTACECVGACIRSCVCVCACVRPCVRARVRAYACVCVRACMRACVSACVRACVNVVRTCMCGRVLVYKFEDQHVTLGITRRTYCII